MNGQGAHRGQRTARGHTEDNERPGGTQGTTKGQGAHRGQRMARGHTEDNDATHPQTKDSGSVHFIECTSCLCTCTMIIIRAGTINQLIDYRSIFILSGDYRSKNP